MSEIKDKFLKILTGWENSVPTEIIPFANEMVDSLTDDLILDFMEKYQNAGLDWGYSQGSFLVRKSMASLLAKIMNFDLNQTENLDEALQLIKEEKIERLVVVSNHLSYADANAFATAFDQNFDGAGFGDDFTVVVGPKVFSHPLRKFASMQFNSLLIAQSQTIATPQRPIPIRVIARAASKVAQEIKERPVKIFFVFPEGKRSREGTMDRFLQGVYRLIDLGENTAVLPCSILGGEKVLPISCSLLRRADVKISIGELEKVSEVKAKTQNSKNAKQDFMDYLGRKVAELIPEERRGVYKI